jgi:hypothetical protein
MLPVILIISGLIAQNFHFTERDLDAIYIAPSLNSSFIQISRRIQFLLLSRSYWRRGSTEFNPQNGRLISEV